MLLSLPLAAMDPNWHTKSDDWLSSKRVEGSSLLELKQVWQTAPPFVKGTVEHLKNPLYYAPHGAPEYRCLVLHGESGSGKSTLAKAIAMYAGWDLEFTSPADYQVGNRGEAAVKLRNKVEEIILRNAPTVLVIDEFNQLLENADSKNHDNDATSKEFWTIMDKTHGNNKFFMVATANRLHKIPKQVKTRIKARTAHISMPEGVDARLKIFTNILARRGFTLNQDATSEMKRILKEQKKWSGRDFDEMCFTINQRFKDEPSWNIKNLSRCLIGSKIVCEAEKVMKESEDTLGYDEEEMTDEERQDLYQAQNMWLQLCMQRFQKHSLMGLRTPGLTRDDGNYIVDNAMTATQKKLAKKFINYDKLREEHL